MPDRSAQNPAFSDGPGWLPDDQQPGCPVCGCPRPHKRSLFGRQRVIADWLAANYQLPFGVEKMADAAGITVRTLQQGCRSALGRTPRQLLAQVRLHRADQLIAAGWTPTEAARATGFTRVDQFRDAYRARYGAESLPDGRRRTRKGNNESYRWAADIVHQSPEHAAAGPTRSPSALRDANEHRAAAGRDRDAARLRAALDRLGDSCPAHLRAVAEARLASPGRTWQQVADALGITKHTATGRHRQLLALATRETKERGR
jgi:AraC-like DNA-binding protein